MCSRLASTWHALRPGVDHVREESEVDLGIVCSRLNGRVTQDVANRLEGGALAKHRGGCRVPQHAGTGGGGGEGGLPDGSRRRLAHHLRRNGSPRGQGREEDGGRVGGGTGVCQVVEASVTTLLGQW